MSLKVSLRNEDLERLRRKLCAVKARPNNLYKEYARKEVRCMQEIEAKLLQSSDTALKLSFAHLQDFDRTHENRCDWLSIELFNHSVPLDVVMNHAVRNETTIPEEFICHIFIEVGRFLLFLHRNCGFTHSDIGPPNIMLFYPGGSDQAALPSATLIYWDVSEKSANLQFGLRQFLDWNNFYDILTRMRNLGCTDSTGTKPQENAEFWEFLEKQMELVGQNMRQMKMEEMVAYRDEKEWGKLEGMAKRRTDNASEEAKKKICRLMKESMSDQGVRVSDDFLKDVVEKSRSGKSGAI